MNSRSFLRASHAATFALLVCATACTGNIGAGDASVEDGDGSGAAAGSEIAVGPSGVARLTRVEYERTVRSIFGDEIVAAVRFDKLPADGKSGRFESNSGLNVNVDSVDAYRILAEDIGANVATHAATLLPCGETDACIDGFIGEYGALVYRRPLGPSEKVAFKTFWDTARADGGTHADALRLVVTAILQTPDFLYRLEKGDPNGEGNVRPLTAYELASRLSFFFWRSGPDEALLDAAARGDLDTAEGIEAAARQLLADPRGDFMLLQFHRAWLGIEDLENHQVDTTFIPDFEALKSDMKAETDDFVLHVFREDDARLETLLTADYSFASPELAAFYGDGVSESSGDGNVKLRPERRSGILTQASFLTAHAPSPTRAAIYRGKSILVDFFCRELVLPDNFDPPNFDPALPARQQIEQVTAGAGCNSCHSMINPLGFVFENYDAIGRWRDTDASQPVDASADIKGTDVDASIVGAPALAKRLAGSKEVSDCLSRQWLRYALSRIDDTLDDRSIEEASERSAGDLRELLVALTATDAFRYRRF